MTADPSSGTTPTAGQDSTSNGTPASRPSARQRRRDMVAKLAARFNRPEFPKGDLAQLRRLDVRRGLTSTDSAFWRIVTHDLEADGLLDGYADDDALGRWMVILQGLATLYPHHATTSRLGQALAAAEIAESRVIRLLRARGPALRALILPLAHQLRSKNQAVNWADVADLVFSETSRDSESVRRHIASDFYRQQYQQSNSQDATSVSA